MEIVKPQEWSQLQEAKWNDTYIVYGKLNLKFKPCTGSEKIHWKLKECEKYGFYGFKDIEDPDEKEAIHCVVVWHNRLYCNNLNTTSEDDCSTKFSIPADLCIPFGKKNKSGICKVRSRLNLCYMATVRFIYKITSINEKTDTGE